ncbi:hypothetical protein AB0H43_20450 [Hamadaea sp. NPDC050747]|uniref:hypothetical protein n=1 Tax=Hamadaea sp. NPDC050747 TaxID=3155789 RepID=UPI0033DEF5C9
MDQDIREGLAKGVKMRLDQASILSQLDGLDALYKQASGTYSSDPEEALCAQHNVSALAVIERVVGRQHSYYEQALKCVESYGIAHPFAFTQVHGVLQGLRADVENGYLDHVRVLVHAAMFTDFVEMADHLLAEGYKDPAAVLLGGALESHLRNLAALHGISLEEPDRSGKLKPKRAQALNQELGKVVYNTLQQKKITAWLDLRNSAAHAKYVDYDGADVQQFSQSLQDFLLRYPA